MRRLRTTSAATEPPPAQVQLRGILRDFQRDHPDFGLSVPGGRHVAGSVDLAMPETSRPARQDGGKIVESQWRNRATKPISPHLYVDPGLVTIPLSETPTIRDHVTVDSWDPNVGEYGGSNVGPSPEFVLGAAMPEVPPPPDLGPSTRRVTLRSGTTLRENIHCDRLSIAGTVWIDGDVTILCNRSFRVANDAAIELRTGATLTIYLGGQDRLSTFASINSVRADPTLVHIYLLDDGQLWLHNHAQVYATIVAPEGELALHNHADFYGTFVGETLTLAEHSGFHLPWGTMCGQAMQDRPGSWGEADGGHVQSAASFDEWFRDVTGINRPVVHPITLNRDGDVYEYFSGAFYPINDRLFGNEGGSNNTSFTYVIAAHFTFDACNNQFIELQGGDGMWLYVDDRLVIDLGGVGPAEPQVIELDRLSLVDGREYVARMFFAQRRTTGSTFGLRTNVVMSTTGRLPDNSHAYD